MEVLNEIGHGLHEKPRENALVAELGLVGIHVRRQDRHPVIYKGVPVHE
jgi:GxxExxY protein